MRVDTGPIFEAFESTMGLVDDAERKRMQQILTASRDSVQRAVLELLRNVAEEVNATGAVEAKLGYGADGIEFNIASPNPAADDAAIEFEFDTGEIERLTLRLPSELKELAAFAAERHGVSLNTWLTRLVSREAVRPEDAAREGRRRRRSGTDGGRRGSGQSLKGWIGG